MAVMAEKSAEATAIRPLTIEFLEADLEDLRARIAATRWPRRRASRTSQGVELATMQAVARYWETDMTRASARPGSTRSQVRHRDRRAGHPFRPRSLEARGRAAARRLPRMARLGVEQMKIVDLLTDPTAHGGERRGRLPSGDPKHAGLRVLGQACDDRVGPDPHGARLHRADEAPRLRAVRGGRRRLRRFVVDYMAGGRDAPSSPEPAPPELLGIHTNFPGVFPVDVDKAIKTRRAATRSLSRRATRGRAPRGRVQACGVRRKDGDAPADMYGLNDSPSSWPPTCSTTTRRATS